ncbi:MAG: transposase [Chitinispirillales bacterium]|nr:transposase [Chitinispirillales bacterium]
MKPEKIIIKTVRQYSKPLPDETMVFLRGIAEDYAKVKAYVYSRFSGINSLEKLYPGYTVQNEMIASNIRNELNLPYNYFGHAIFDALGNIKSIWSNIKLKIIDVVKQNENLTDSERHYVFSILKRDKLLAAILNRRDYELPKSFESKKLNFKRLNNLICRLVRKYHVKPETGGKADYFHCNNVAYRYQRTGDGKTTPPLHRRGIREQGAECGGIYFSSRIPNKRVFVPLTDNAIYNKQITVKLLDNAIEIIAPIAVKPKNHSEYNNSVALSLGYVTMLTSSSGNEYGEKLGELLSRRSERIYQKRGERGKHYGIYKKLLESGDIAQAKRVKENNLGIKKTTRQNTRELERIKSYINTEFNIMLKKEKPSEIIIPARSKQFGDGMQKATKQKLSGWMVGYIRKRLDDKCAVNSVKITEVNGAYTGKVCSQCGGVGERANQIFKCCECGVKIPYPQNAARNLFKTSVECEEWRVKLKTISEERVL